MDATWTPPRGSTEIEPGWWQTPDGSLYSDNTTLEPTEDEKREATERRREEAAQRVRRHAALVPGLIDQILGLRMQVYLTELFLEEALTMLAEEKAQVAFLERQMDYEAWRDATWRGELIMPGMVV